MTVKAEITVKQECKLWQLLCEDALLNTKSEVRRLLLSGKIIVNGKEAVSIESLIKVGDVVVIR